MTAMMNPMYLSTFKIFILVRMYDVFQTLPKKYRILTNITYHTTNIIILIICFLLVFALWEGTKDTFKVEMFIAVDNNKYKECHMSVFDPPKIWGMQLYNLLCGGQLSILMYIQFICIIKLYQINKYSNNGYIYNDFNMPYLHKKIKQIKIMLCLPIINFMLLILCVVINMLSEYEFYQIVRIVDTFIIIYFINIYFNDQTSNNNNNLSV
eukprot:207944_1